MKFGVQLFGLKAMLAKGPEELFAALSTLGIKQIEPCVAFEDLGEFSKYIFSPATLEENRTLIEKYGLEIPSCHIFARNVGEMCGELVDFSRSSKIKQLVLPCPRELDDTTISKFVADCKMLSAELSAVGSELLIHNSVAESEKRYGDICAYEHILNLCGDGVYAQADVGWLLAGGVDPEEFLWRNKARVRSLHMKDVNPGEKGDLVLGKGSVDLTACFAFARATGISQIIDQDDDSGDIIADIGEALRFLQSLAAGRERTGSVLCVFDTMTGELRELRRFDGIIEAPNWVNGEETLIYNSNGLIWNYDIESDEISPVKTGYCDNCNNDHVLLPNGKGIAVSHSEKGGWMSRVYIIPFDSGYPKEITANAPSFLHGCSPDGKELAYCAFRQTGGTGFLPGGIDVDVYSISADGGEEMRLTHGEGFNDGPEYSFDGEHIFINSTRTGLMQIWRIDKNGANPTQLTFENSNAWFAHQSPDGQKIVYITYREGELDAAEHLPNMQVELWLMNSDGSDRHRILELFGGQGTINVNSWSADSRRFAFVKYELEHK